MADAPKSRKPKDTAFKQQRLPAWQPILTPGWVIGTFLFLGFIFIPIGVVLKIGSDSVVEYRQQYDGSGTPPEYDSCRLSSPREGLNCTMTFTADKRMVGPVYVYYELDNYYQNHRRYVKSRSSDQLLGEVLDESELDDCEPLVTAADKILSPCGLIAQSFFNDIIKLRSTSYTMDESGIAWDTDVEDKFIQPDGFKYDVMKGDESCDDQLDVSGAKNYTDANVTYCYYYPKDDEYEYLYERFPLTISPIEGVTNEHFIVWMRTAGLPNFRKLYGIIDHDVEKGEELKFHLYNQYYVSDFDGKKYLVISTTTWFGGKNPFLGIAYIVVGVLCVVLGIAFGFKYAIAPRKLGDPKYLDWKHD